MAVIHNYPDARIIAVYTRGFYALFAKLVFYLAGKALYMGIGITRADNEIICHNSLVVHTEQL